MKDWKVSLKNYSKYQQLSLKYLQCDKNTDNSIISSIDDAYYQIDKISNFKYIYTKMTKCISVLNKEPYKKYIKSQSEYYIVAATLGIQIDKEISKLSNTDPGKMFILDSCSSAYLETASDEYENTQFNNNSMFRFCPGYQGSNIKDIYQLQNYLNVDKIGIEVMKSNLLVPSKSIIGLLFKLNNKKSCNNCIMNKNCNFKVNDKNATCW